MSADLDDGHCDGSDGSLQIFVQLLTGKTITLNLRPYFPGLPHGQTEFPLVRVWHAKFEIESLLQ
jgi:hypothetical protein